MMQRTIAAYVANKVKEEIFNPKEVDDEGDVHIVEPQHDPLDGEMIRDNEGRSLGRAYRVPTAAVYVVGGTNANPDVELERALNDPDTETIIHWEGNEIAALVFVPSQARDGAVNGVRGVRADDV
jgi:hypothetical protein